jgi:hypothetical protein
VCASIEEKFPSHKWRSRNLDGRRKQIAEIVKEQVRRVERGDGPNAPDGGSGQDGGGGDEDGGGSGQDGGGRGEHVDGGSGAPDGGSGQDGGGGGEDSGGGEDGGGNGQDGGGGGEDGGGGSGGGSSAEARTFRGAFGAAGGRGVAGGRGSAGGRGGRMGAGGRGAGKRPKRKVHFQDGVEQAPDKVREPTAHRTSHTHHTPLSTHDSRPTTTCHQGLEDPEEAVEPPPGPKKTRISTLGSAAAAEKDWRQAGNKQPRRRHRQDSNQIH